MKTKPKVLVVDDDPDIVDQLSLVLQAQGCEVITGTSQEQAEELLLHGRPDLAIFDLMMEQMDSGFILSHYLKKLYPDVPVILLTAVTAATGMSFGSTSPEARRWVKADVILDKPVRAEQVQAEVARLLGDRIAAAPPHGPHA
ncbi:MAG: response regulator [Acidobacteria bacterium]|nr:response regulator [Planctomycetota bacterium]MBE3133373.1 response regulator [Acidobacteriota bacterium]